MKSRSSIVGISHRNRLRLAECEPFPLFTPERLSVQSLRRRQGRLQTPGFRTLWSCAVRSPPATLPNSGQTNQSRQKYRYRGRACGPDSLAIARPTAAQSSCRTPLPRPRVAELARLEDRHEPRGSCTWIHADSRTTKPASIANRAGAVGFTLRMYSRNRSRRWDACWDFEIVAGIAPQARVYMWGVPTYTSSLPRRPPHIRTM